MLIEKKVGFEKASSGVTLSTQSRASDKIKRNGRLSKDYEWKIKTPGLPGGFFVKNPKVSGTLEKRGSKP